MTTDEFDAARVALARKHGREPAFINSLLLTYVRHYVEAKRLQCSIEAVDEVLMASSPREAA